MLNPAFDPHPDTASARRENPAVQFSSGAIQEHDRVAGPDSQDPDGVVSLSFRENDFGSVGTKTGNEKTVHALLARS
jgi:hypothetical protein